jgi:PhnB protein
MAKVSTYLNFKGNTFEVFEFYKSVFGTEYSSPVTRMGDVQIEGMPPAGENTKDLIMNIQLPILGGHVLMGTDTPGDWGEHLIIGNNVSIMLHTDSRAQADELFAALSDGGAIEMPMADQFWGDYYGSLDDKFGVSWMIAFSPDR